MTKKHFEALAAALLKTRPDRTWLAERDQWDKDVDAIIDVLKASNPQFNILKFQHAAGVDQ